MKGFIYKHTNLKNGKVYIGQTIQEPEKRWGKDGCNYSANRGFYRDIIQYGWDNFQHEILEVVEATTKKELQKALNKTENYYILYMKSMLHDHGYNTAIKDKRLSQAAKRSISSLMEQGSTLDESYDIYKSNKRTKKKR
jgi:group I intron endonuclease